MKKSISKANFPLISFFMIIAAIVASCKKDENPIKFPFGTVPDTVTVALTDLNSQYDDYNLDIHQLYNTIEVLFSSNRNSALGKFDIIQGGISFLWDQTTGAFGYDASITSDPFLTALISSANTEGNDFGPYRFFSTVDGNQYMLLSSETTADGLDFYYLKNFPIMNNTLPTIYGPYPATLLNTSSNDAYISFDLNQDTAFFSSDRSGNFDIYAMKRPADMSISNWLGSSYTPATPIDSLNTTSDDKCPFVYKKIMVFTSNRPGGMGGYDLYFSTYKDGKWSSPENFGPDVNTTYNEYRPVITMLTNYNNYLMMFSSDRPGGKGGFDLYFRGISFDKR